ncbi:MAG: AAA family ATPase, partial [Nanoarchaeota archaeon]
MYIEFKYLKYKNFMSYPNKETKFDFTKGLHLLKGTNGSGKSSGVLDPLSFNLFGKPYRKIKKDELINRINKKKLYTESQFVINKDTYTI